MVDMRDWVPLPQTGAHMNNETQRIRMIQEKAKADDLFVKDLKLQRRELVKTHNPLNTYKVTNLLSPWVNNPPFKKRSNIRLL